MMTAKQAQELVEIARKAEIKAKIEKAERTCEELDGVIKIRASNRYTTLTTEIEAEIRSYVIQILHDNGYKTAINFDNTITVEW